ncbi:hypothetical protein BDQ17DRAFT_1330286 [Cyathus striatus]|nr:hypothetical protein BDQ17DRAFT_1330286 [Cyathus striatus]
MPFLPSDAIQMAAIGLEHTQIINYIRAATLAVLVYEYLLTFYLEVNFVWKRNWNVVKILFLITRYLPFIAATTSLTIQFLPHTSAVKCKMLYTTIACLSIGFFMAECIAIVYLLLDDDKIWTWESVNMVLILVPAYQSFRLGYYSSLAQVVLRDVTKLNNDYFIVVLILGRQMYSILACRVVLHAREEGSKAYRGSISVPLTKISFT